MEAESSAREASVESRANQRIKDLEERLTKRVTECEAEKQSLSDQLHSLSLSHRQYQERKGREVKSLEARIVSLITNGGEPSDQGTREEGGGQVKRKVNGGGGGVFYSRVSKGCHHGPCRGMAAAVPPPPNKTEVHRRGSVANPRPQGRGGGRGRGGVRSSSPPGGPSRAASSPPPRLSPSRCWDAENQALADLDEEGGDEEEGESSSLLRRELLFEKLHKQRAEAQLSSARDSIQRLKARLGLITRSLEEVHESCLTKEEGARLQQEANQVKEQLKLARAESARRGRALQIMQSIANPASLSSSAGPSGSGVSTSSPPASPTSHNQGGGLSTMTTALGVPIADLMDAGGDFEAVAAAAYQAERQARALFEKERSLRLAVESKSKEIRSNLERKTAMVATLQSKVTELEEEVGCNQAKQEALEALEGKSKQLQSTISRKDLAFKELKDRLTTSELQLGLALAKQSDEDQQDRARREAARFKTELSHKDATIKALTSQLEDERVKIRGEIEAFEASLQRAKSKEEVTRRRMVDGLRALITSIAACIDRALQAGASSSSQDREVGSSGGFFVDEIASLTGGSLSVNEIRDLLFSDLHPNADEDGGGGERVLSPFGRKLEPLLLLLESGASEGDEVKALRAIGAEVTSLVQDAVMKLIR